MIWIFIEGGLLVSVNVEARIERIPDNSYFKKLLILSGLGYTFDAMDGAIVAFVLTAIINPWHLTSAQTGVLGSSLLIGYFIGAFCAGYFGDLFGRKKVIMWTLLIYSVATMISAFATNWTEFFWFRVIAGVGTGGESAIIAPYLSELIASKFRGKYVGTLAGFFSFGYVGAAVLSYLIIPTSPIGWRIAVFITALPIFLIVIWRRALPESPRWLESRGRHDEADRVLSDIEAKVERRLGEKLSEPRAIDNLYTDAGKKGRFTDLWRKPFVRSTVMLWTFWFSMVFAYYGFFTWIPTLLFKQGLQIAKSFEFSLIIYLAQIPGYFSGAYLNDRIGRKKVIVFYLICAAVSAFFMSRSHSSTAIVVWGFLMSLFMNGVWAGAYTYTPEQYPTLVRATGVGSASSFGRIGGLLAPIVIGYILPIYGFSGVFILTTLVLLAGMLAVLILGRETKGKLLEEITAEQLHLSRMVQG
jgi:putative MFS transporter